VTPLPTPHKTADWQVVNLISDWQRLQPAWDEFVAHHPKGSVFHSSPMVTVWQATKGIAPLPLAAVTDSGEILALLVAARVQALSVTFGGVSSRSVCYAEPLCLDTQESIEALCGLIAAHDRMMRRQTLFAEVRPLCASGIERVALDRTGFRHMDYLNYVIDTTLPRKVLWKNMRHSAHTNIRKCERLGFTIRHVESPEVIDQFYDLLKGSFAHASVPLADRSLFEAALRVLRPLGMMELAGVYDGDIPLAMVAMLLWKRQAYSWYCGSVRIPGVPAMDFLRWHEIAWSCEHGYSRYDFGGAGWPNVPYGVRQFKSKFGGELVCYGRYRKVYAPWKLAVAEQAYRIGQKLMLLR
jgi:serine/alanine adding enzyme